MANQPQLPVILIHGYIDVPILSGTWKLTEEVLRGMGVTFYTPQISPQGSITERSDELVLLIAAHFPPGQTVHLFGHSMGGLNARDLASRALTADLGFKIQTVTTFATPHRGVGFINFARVMPKAVGRLLHSIIGTDLGAFSNLTPTYLSDFNGKTVKNNPDVRYFSWAGLTRIPSVFFSPVFPFSRPYGPTDGLVNVSSATWGIDLGTGTHLGTLDGVDHLSIINIATVKATLPHLHAAENGGTAVVQLIDNNSVQSFARGFAGGIDTLFSPARALLALVGWR